MKEKIAGQFVPIQDIEVGESFFMSGGYFTKLNDSNFCIINDYNENYMKCIFDPMSNDYRQSMVRQYINSNRFINKLMINKDNLVPMNIEDGSYDFITLLSVDEYSDYQGFIKDYFTMWITRSLCKGESNLVYYIGNSGISYSVVNFSSALRICLTLKPDTEVIWA